MISVGARQGPGECGDDAHEMDNAKNHRMRTVDLHLQIPPGPHSGAFFGYFARVWHGR